MIDISRARRLWKGLANQPMTKSEQEMACSIALIYLDTIEAQEAELELLRPYAGIPAPVHELFVVGREEEQPLDEYLRP